MLAIKLHLANYHFLFTDPLYLDSFFYSIKVAAVSTLLCLLLGYPMALASRARRRRAATSADAGDPAVLDLVPDAHLRLDRPAEG